MVLASAMVSCKMSLNPGLNMEQAVQASLTALEGSMAGVQGREVDAAVNYVFDTVFNREFIADFINEDEYI